MASDYVTTGEAAKAIGVGHMTLLRWMKAGHVTPAAKTPGGQYRWDLDDLRRQLRETSDPDRH
jgi:excisionase family DNA binding protein